jgi:hypothetical protein
MTHYITGIKRDGGIELTSGSNGLELSFTESYRVKADDKLATMWEVMSTAVAENAGVADLLGYNGDVQTNGLPLPGVTEDRDRICRCRSLNGERNEENPLLWEFTARFSSNVPEGNTGQDATVPLEEVIPVRETLYELVNRARSIDLSGQGYTNGAGHLYNPALQVEEELPRWDFTQFDIDYTGSVAATSTLYSGLSSSAFAFSLLTKADTTTTSGVIYPPGVYRNIAGINQFYAPTDASIYYFNGCLNSISFRGFDPFTLLLKVRSSKVGFFRGQRKRVTEYSLIFDERNHFDKPINAGPFFIAPKLDAATGDEVVPQEFVSYPYIYYSQDEEDDGTDLAIDQDGLLTRSTLAEQVVNKNLILAFNPDEGKLQHRTVFAISGGVNYGLFPARDGWPLAGVKKAKTSSGKFTYRAAKADASVEPMYIEFANHNLLNFNNHLRVL